MFSPCVVDDLDQFGVNHNVLPGVSGLDFGGLQFIGFNVIPEFW